VKPQVPTIEQLADRRAHYSKDQRNGLHGTIISLALGVAGLSAASIFEVSPADRPYHPLLWLFWLISLVSVGTVYSGMTVNVYALPSTIPGALDIFLPLGMGLAEFMLFAVLTSPLNSQLSPRSLVAVWFGCFCLFSCIASMSIIRVTWLFEHTVFEGQATQAAVSEMVVSMRRDVLGASSSALVSGATAMVIGWVHAIPLTLAFPV
jgi:hypothetical protein